MAPTTLSFEPQAVNFLSLLSKEKQEEFQSKMGTTTTTNNSSVAVVKFLDLSSCDELLVTTTTTTTSTTTNPSAMEHYSSGSTNTKSPIITTKSCSFEDRKSVSTAATMPESLCCSVSLGSSPNAVGVTGVDHKNINHNGDDDDDNDNDDDEFSELSHLHATKCFRIEDDIHFQRYEVECYKTIPEASDLWYSRDELDTMKRENEGMVYLLDHGKSVDSFGDDTTRGLEKLTEEGAWARYECIRDAINAVILLQVTQELNSGTTDADEIAQVYITASQKAVQDAWCQGQQDEQDAQQAYNNYDSTDKSRLMTTTATTTTATTNPNTHMDDSNSTLSEHNNEDEDNSSSSYDDISSISSDYIRREIAAAESAATQSKSEVLTEKEEQVECRVTKPDVEVSKREQDEVMIKPSSEERAPVVDDEDITSSSSSYDDISSISSDYIRREIAAAESAASPNKSYVPIEQQQDEKEECRVTKHDTKGSEQQQQEEDVQLLNKSSDSNEPAPKVGDDEDTTSSSYDDISSISSDFILNEIRKAETIAASAVAASSEEKVDLVAVEAVDSSVLPKEEKREEEEVEVQQQQVITPPEENKEPASPTCKVTPLPLKSCFQTQSKPKRNVILSEELSEHDVPMRKHIPIETWPDLWWTRDEMLELRRDYEGILFLLETGRPLDDELESARGLEIRTEDGEWAFYEHKRDGWNAVLGTQEDQERAGQEMDYEEMAQAYTEEIERMQTNEQAVERARQDYEAIKEYLAIDKDFVTTSTTICC